MHLKDQLEELRAILFTGKPRHSFPQLTQPEYVEWFEGRVERDPETEWQAMYQYLQPIISLYRKQLEEMDRMEAYIHGKSHSPPAFDDETVLQKVYEEIMELETEEEWQAWVQHWVKQVNDRPSDSQN